MAIMTNRINNATEETNEPANWVIWASENHSSHWNTSVLLSSKKWDLTVYENHRGIRSLDVAAKANFCPAYAELFPGIETCI